MNSSKMHFIYCYLLVLQRKIAKFIGVTMIYYSSKGIKSVNPLIKNCKHQVLKERMIDYGNLFLGIDFLKDNYTLCNVNLLDSPHYMFLKALKDNKELKDTDYFKRFSNGTLDSRIPVYINRRMYESFKFMYDKRTNELENGKIQPVVVYKLNGKYYIADGKHRAALCALNEKQVPCIEISSDYLIDSYRLWMYEKMRKKKDLYKINIEIYNLL